MFFSISYRNEHEDEFTNSNNSSGEIEKELRELKNVISRAKREIHMKKAEFHNKNV